VRARGGSIPSTIAQRSEDQGSGDPNPGDSQDSIGKQSVEKRHHSGYSSKQRADRRAQGLLVDPNRDHATVYNDPLHTAVAEAKCPESAHTVVLYEEQTTGRSEDQGSGDPSRTCIVRNGPLHTTIAGAKCPTTALEEQRSDDGDSEDTNMHDDPTQISALFTDLMHLKFDTGASRCMSGDPDRLIMSRPVTRPVRITGFNGKGSSPTSMGVNADGKEEYYVEDMPRNLALLCENAYCQDGCAVLFEDGGLVLKMNQAELTALK
jgi:hypothetical protein